jgi:hypothetical protein
MHFLRILLTSLFLLLSTQATAWQRNPSVEPALWDELSPYFFPENRPEKAILDKICKKRRILNSVKDMHSAKFLVFTNQKEKIIVARHYKLPGILMKVYLDGSNAVDWFWWRKRIQGANTVREAIERHGYGHIMKVPHKWMYALPADPPPKRQDPGIPRKNFVLLVENMNILGPNDNYKAFKKWITKEHLIALYTIITECGLLDSVYADNIPFCEDGKIAFIDTEHAHNTPPYPLENIGQYLSKEMLPYWEQLIQGNPI